MENGFNPVLGQSFPKFVEYNKLALEDVQTAYTNSFEELGDPNKLLAVKTCTSTCPVNDREYITVKHSLRDGNNPRDSKQMNDRDQQSYFVSLVKWVKNNHEEETLMEMAAKGIPPKRVCSLATLKTQLSYVNNPQKHMCWLVRTLNSQKKTDMLA